MTCSALGAYLHLLGQSHKVTGIKTNDGNFENLAHFSKNPF